MTVDLSKVPHAVRVKMDELIRKDFDLHLLKALERQNKAAAHYWRHQPRSVDGIGGLKMVLDPVFDAMYRRKYGHQWLDDEDRVKWCLKKAENAAAKVKSGGTGKIQVGYRGVGGRGRVVKRYVTEKG